MGKPVAKNIERQVCLHPSHHHAIPRQTVGQEMGVQHLNRFRVETPEEVLSVSDGEQTTRVIGHPQRFQVAKVHGCQIFCDGGIRGGIGHRTVIVEQDFSELQRRVDVEFRAG